VAVVEDRLDVESDALPVDHLGVSPRRPVVERED
jgi:hypothetical protein